MQPIVDVGRDTQGDFSQESNEPFILMQGFKQESHLFVAFLRNFGDGEVTTRPANGIPIILAVEVGSRENWNVDGFWTSPADAGAFPMTGSQSR